MLTKIFDALWRHKATMSQQIDPLHNKIDPTLQWRHNWRDAASNHQPYDYLLNRLFRRRSKKTSKLRITDLC